MNYLKLKQKLPIPQYYEINYKPEIIIILNSY